MEQLCLNDLYLRHQVELFGSRHAAREKSRLVHFNMVEGRADRIRSATLSAEQEPPMSRAATTKITKAELERHGIVRVPAEMFLWGNYRYTNARDALAAAKRGAAK
jgi:hypothetical protein